MSPLEGFCQQRIRNKRRSKATIQGWRGCTLWVPGLIMEMAYFFDYYYVFFLGRLCGISLNNRDNERVMHPCFFTISWFWGGLSLKVKHVALVTPSRSLKTFSFMTYTPRTLSSVLRSAWRRPKLHLVRIPHDSVKIYDQTPPVWARWALVLVSIDVMVACVYLQMEVILICCLHWY